MSSKRRTYQLDLSGKKTIIRPRTHSCELKYSEPKGYQANLYGKRAAWSTKPSKDGNVVLGFTSDTYLMLDVDFQWLPFVKEFAVKYARFHKLGSVLMLKTSDDYLTDFFGNKLGKYCIIFGRPLRWKEIQWHIAEARRLGIIERAFTKLREFGSITIRVNAKNNRTPPPMIIKFYANGDMRGIRDYVQFSNRFRNLGFFEGKRGD